MSRATTSTNLHLSGDEAAIVARARQDTDTRWATKRTSPWALAGYVAVALGIAAAGVGGLGAVQHHAGAWYDRAPRIEKALNARYVEPIQYARSGRHEQTFVIDGTLRTDCGVPDDDRPYIRCLRPVHLTLEPPR